jgi:hypothetical protein
MMQWLGQYTLPDPAFEGSRRQIIRRKNENTSDAILRGRCGYAFWPSFCLGGMEQSRVHGPDRCSIGSFLRISSRGRGGVRSARTRTDSGRKQMERISLEWMESPGGNRHLKSELLIRPLRQRSLRCAQRFRWHLGSRLQRYHMEPAHEGGRPDHF